MLRDIERQGDRDCKRAKLLRFGDGTKSKRDYIERQGDRDCERAKLLRFGDGTESKKDYIERHGDRDCERAKLSRFGDAPMMKVKRIILRNRETEIVEELNYRGLEMELNVKRIDHCNVNISAILLLNSNRSLCYSGLGFLRHMS